MKHSLLLILFATLQAPSILAQPDPSSIDIVRDRWGVPHIFAPTDAGVSYGLAWAHAEDDFATIQQTIMAGKRMVGRVIGRDGAAIDYFVHLIKARELVDDHIEELSPAYRKVIDAYTAGINAYAREHPKKVIHKKIFPVTVNEVVTAYVLSLTVMSSVDRIVGDLVNNRIHDDPYSYTGNGSNAIAVSRKKTTDGYTYLAINSHQPLEGPVSWYEAHLCSEEGWNILGGLFPGGATVFHGVNETLGWAHTVNYPDKVDVYKLKMDPDQKDHYILNGSSLPLEVRKVKLKVKLLGIPIGIKKKAYWSEFGATVKNDSGYYSIRFGANMDIRPGEQWYYMNKATNLEEFKKALEMTAISGFNIVYADKEDNLYYISNGKIPVRDPAYHWRKTLRADTTATLWTQFHPLADLPQITNPSSGYLFNMNNTVYNASGTKDNIDPATIDQTMGYPYYDNNRSIRFQQLMAKHERLSYADFKKIKYDHTLPDSLYYRQDANKAFRLDPASYPDIADYIQGLRDWDRKGNRESTGATLFKVLYDLVDRGRGTIATEQNLVEVIRLAKSELTEKYGTIYIPLGEYQVHQRGDMELALDGLPDVIATINTQPYKGKERATHGESHIIMVRFGEDGPILESVNAFGASNDPDSPYYTDQMELFVNHQLKPMTLDKKKIYAEAARVYHPE
jgi:acyl-homoserine-lactone acylase